MVYRGKHPDYCPTPPIRPIRPVLFHVGCALGTLQLDLTERDVDKDDDRVSGKVPWLMTGEKP